MIWLTTSTLRANCMALTLSGGKKRRGATSAMQFESTTSTRALFIVISFDFGTFSKLTPILFVQSLNTVVVCCVLTLAAFSDTLSPFDLGYCSASVP